MNFDEALVLIDEQEITDLRICNYNEKNTILKLSESTPAELVQKLQAYKNSLMSYGKVVFICATKKIVSASWRDALHWDVTFSGLNLPQVNNFQNPMAGYVSPTESALKEQLMQLTLQINFDKKLAELESKFSKKGSSGDDIMKYIPLLGLFMKIDPDKLAQMATLGTLTSVMNGNTPPAQPSAGMSGLKDNPSLEVTPEEEKVLDEIENEIVELSSKVQLTSVRDFMHRLNEDPTLIKKLEALITAMA